MDLILLFDLKNIQMTRVINTVSAYRSLLQEDDNELKELGVKKLVSHIALHWIDIANDINLIESLYQDQTFPNHPLVAFLLAKLYFYLNDYDEALKYALKSEDQFNIKEAKDEFTQILVNKCIEKYIQSCQGIETEEHSQYKTIVDYVIESSLSNGEYKMAMGIALDTKDRQLFSRVFSIAEFNEFVQNLLPHLLGLDIEFRRDILAKVAERIPQTFKSPTQYLNLLQLLQIKGDYEIVAKIIYELVKRDEKQIAYTLALQVSQIHGFNKKVLASIPIETEFENQRKILSDIIQGQFASSINNKVLRMHAKTDPFYLAALKKIESKYSIAHGSAILGLSMLQGYTQDDSFLQVKENLEWVAKSTHWNKFSSIASLGVIFRGHKDRSVFSKFLPENNAGDGINHYSNGGALYGLGLLYTGTANQAILDYIIQKTTNPTLNQNDVVMHGACLGLGLTAFASGHQNTAQRLKDILRASTSVMGEASALALGLIYAGTNNQSVISQLIATASESEHQKIIRSVCIAIGLISFQSPSAEFLKNLEQNPTIKLAIPYYLACAYFKTSNPNVVRKLLKLSNDISNQVKRAAIISLGFVLYQDQKLISVIKMLLYSYNPYIRYGCIMALAIGSKNTKEAIELIWPSLTDSVDFVRQGAYISLALLLQVSTNNSEPKLADFRKSIEQILVKTHGDQMTKLGAILAIGILDIGGRNMNLSLTTRSGMPKLQAISGILIFSQYWNWFPYINFISLAISPSMLIGVTSKLKIPTNFQIHSNCKPSLFDYPANIPKQEKKKDDKKQAAKQLSTTNKVRARLLKKKESEMEIQTPSKPVRTPSLISTLKDPAVEPEKAPKPQQKPVEKKQEETSSILKNPARIAEKQKVFITFVEGRYTPILPNRKLGISFLKDSTPDLPDKYLGQKEQPQKMDIQKPSLEKIVEQKKKDDDDLAPPEQFQYDEEKEKLMKDSA